MTVQELLSDESKWTKFTSARDSLGIPVSSCDEEAVKFCLSGAICKCYTPEEQEGIENRLLFFTGTSYVDFNDDPKTTFADIRRVIEAANI